MTMTILLTATVDPNGCSYVARSSVEDRMLDYLSSLRRWLNETDFDIVFVENSGFDLGFLKKEFADKSGRVEYISFDGNRYERSLGKGYGELEILRFAMSNSSKLSVVDRFVKSTGRYFFPELSDFLSSIDVYDYDYVGIYNENVIHTGFFVACKQFLSGFLDGLVPPNPINDAGGYYIEHLFHQIAFSTERRLLIGRLGADGISGTFGTPITWM